jgi:signal transduction histidine kinase/ActR/RegA family two-component response regulator
VPRGRPYGVLTVYTVKRRRFAPAEVEFVRAVARVIAIALGREYGERALFEEMQMSTVLAHVGRELMACPDVSELLPIVCQLTAHALRCDHSVTWLRRPDEGGFRPVAADGMPTAQWQALQTAVLPGPEADALLAELLERETLHLAVPSPRHVLLSSLLAASGVRCAVIAPLLQGEDAVGFQVSGHRDRSGEITAHDERVAQGVAQLAATALMNARVVEELERASQLKSEFVSTMSHELRTPLNIIIGYTDMLRDVASVDEQAPLLTQIRKASHELLEMIDGTLNLNRLAAGGDVARFAPVALADLWRELRDDFAALPARPDVALHWEDGGGLALQTDRRKLKIVFKNLVGNALKFTAAGAVVVAAERVGDRCRITVRDTGIGIVREALPHVFDMFRQADSSETRSYGGAGLGLYIVRSLLLQLGGEVQVESLVGQGSIFTVVLPLEQPVEAVVPIAAPPMPSTLVAPAPDAVPDECARHARRTLLFADDLPLNRLLVRRFIAKEFPRVDVLEACDGEQAVAAFETHHPDLVLLDLHMPQLDGWQAASAIRRRPRGLEIPIVALSVDASPMAEANAVRAGFQEFIAKPISDYSALKARLEFWLGPRDARGRAITPAPSPTCAMCRGEGKRASAA